MDIEQWIEESFMTHGIWYHATTISAYRSIAKNGVIADINKSISLDFGYGFYLTPNFNWAKDYAHGLSAKGVGSENDGVILEFHFIPKQLLNGSSNYRFFERLDDEFAEFVFENRMFYKDSPTYCIHDYLMVGGVMSDGAQELALEEYEINPDKEAAKKKLFEELCRPEEDWQLLVHSQAICDRLQIVKVYDEKGELTC